MVEEPIDERLLLKWEPSSPPKDLLEGELVVDESEMNIDETLNGLRRMIYLLSQLQTLRMAAGTAEIPEREKALGISSAKAANCSRQHCFDVPKSHRQLFRPSQCPHFLAPTRSI